MFKIISLTASSGNKLLCKIRHSNLSSGEKFGRNREPNIDDHHTYSGNPMQLFIYNFYCKSNQDVLGL